MTGNMTDAMFDALFGTRKKGKPVDPEAFQLAGYFLSGADWVRHKQRLGQLQQQLAEAIQTAIEEELQNAEYEGVGL